MNTFCWDRFRAVPLIGILRGFDRRLLPGIIRASVAGGLTSIEITMNSSDASGQIGAATKLADGRLNVGAGTVLNIDLLDAALTAGASYIVTPALEVTVVRSCLQRNVPVFPGVFTPSEILRAHDLGVSWAKLFPAETLGAPYIRSIKDSFPNLNLLPTGGVSLDTLPELLAAGADGFGIGSPLFAPDRIRAEDWPWLENRCRTFVELYKTCRRQLNSEPLCLV